MMSMRILNHRAIGNGFNKFVVHEQRQASAAIAVATTASSSSSSSFRTTPRLQQYTAKCNYMSSQPCTSPEEEVVQMMLILGKPGGGKGTISEKLLKVSFVAACLNITAAYI